MLNKKVAICVPCRIAPYGLWFNHFCNFLNHLNKIKQKYQLFVGFDPTNHVGTTRERISDEVLSDRTCDYMLWLDDDIFFPIDILERFFNTEKNIVTGIYWNKSNPKKPLLQKKPEDLLEYEFYKHEKEKLFKIQSCGFGCFFIKTEILHYLIKPRFPLTSPNGQGEDIFFCLRLAYAGKTYEELELYASANILCKHMIFKNGELSYLPDEETWRKVNEQYNT